MIKRMKELDLSSKNKQAHPYVNTSRHAVTLKRFNGRKVRRENRRPQFSGDP